MAWDRTTDLLLVRSGEALDYHKGVLRDVSPGTVEFVLDGELLPVKRAKVYGLIYYHPPGDPLPEPLCQVSDVGGSQWSVQTLKLADSLTWTTPGGLKRTQPVATIRQIDFSRGKVVFLSDLKPESVAFTPYFGAGKATQPLLAKFFALREDKNLQSGPLQLGSKQYGKGLAMHSQTKVVYRLPGRSAVFGRPWGSTTRFAPRATCGWSFTATTACCWRPRSPAPIRPRRRTWSWTGSAGWLCWPTSARKWTWPIISISARQGYSNETSMIGRFAWEPGAEETGN